MKPATARLLAGALLFLLVPGCTIVRVTQVRPADEQVDTAWHFWLNPVNLWNEATHHQPAESDADARGLRFFLPKPYLLVTPNATGGIDVETVFLPDPAQQYAVESRVYVASQNFNLTLADGMLQKISYKPDQTAVLNRLIEAGGNVGAEVITKQGELAKAEADEAKKQADSETKQRAEAAAALEKAHKELEDAKFATSQAEQALADFDSLHPNPTTEQRAQRQKLEAALREAQRAEEQKAAAVARLKGAEALAQDFLGKREQSIAEVPGPALFEIVETADGVRLKPVDFVLDGHAAVQAELKTYWPASPGPGTLALAQGPTAPVAASGESYVVDFLFRTSLAEGATTVGIQGPGDDAPWRFLRHGPPTAQQKMSSYYLVEGAKLTLVLAKAEHAVGHYRLAVVSSTYSNRFTDPFELR